MTPKKQALTIIHFRHILLLLIGLSLAAGCSRTPPTTPADSQTEPESETAADPVQAPTQTMLLDLDTDQNGLYDDSERKAMLDVLLQACPELQAHLISQHTQAKIDESVDDEAPIEDILLDEIDIEIAKHAAATFDTDGDGKVTIAEQTAGRHPLSMLVPAHFLDSGIQIPWALDIFSEWISTAYFQEDVEVGAVSEYAPRGTVSITATQSEQVLQPRKSVVGNGVEFAANTGQHLSMPGHRDARWNYRWCIFTFRLDAGTGADAETVLLDLNQGNTSSKSSPKIWYNKDTGLSIQFVGENVGGVDRRIMTTTDVATDGQTWNVVVCGIRYGQMFASVNGRSLAAASPQPPRFSGDWPHDTTSYIGDPGQGNAAWGLDSLVFGLTEPSEAMVRKMTGWAAHRLGFQANLPADHPYATQRPVLDAEDFPRRYVHDNEKWMAWGASLKQKETTRVNAGGPRVAPQGFERVFYDDFRADRVKASTSGEGDLWVGPGFNVAVGADAPLVTPGQEPEVYAYDAATHKQTLSLARDSKRWRGSAFYSVNDLGHGYTWTGPKIFRIRCMFPKVSQDDLAGGLFPAFWSYGTDNLVWRTGNRIEADWFEFDGQNGQWYNGLSTHYHYAYLRRNIFAKNPDSYPRYKVYSGELKESKSKIPGGVFFWDGQYHTWEFVIDRDMTYVNISITDENGNERMVEICRSATAPTYLERLDLQLDYALKANHGVPKDGARQDFIVDWIEVLQKSDAINVLPSPFTARPVVTRDGDTLTCTANVENISDIRYYWFADGYPLTYGPSSTYTLTADHANATIRCMVKAVGARDMPEAWSNTLE